jgi:ATP-dependent Clp protease adaptor protein ClpS
MSEREQNQLDGEVMTEDDTSTQRPRPYDVILHNDDYTTMEFVQMILVAVFQHSHSSAAQLMLQVHTQGKAVAGTYTRDIAETKRSEAEALARGEGHPLKCTVQPAG